MNLNQKKEAIRKGLINAREDTIDFFKSLNESQLEIKMNRENDESWTIFEVIKHIYGAEDGMTRLMIGIKDGGEGVPEDFDLKRYNMRRVSKLGELKSKDDLLNLLASSRLKLLEFLSIIDEIDLQKKGRHAIGKILTIEQIFSICETHEINHIEKCRKLLEY